MKAKRYKAVVKCLHEAGYNSFNGETDSKLRINVIVCLAMNVEEDEDKHGEGYLGNVFPTINRHI